MVKVDLSPIREEHGAEVAFQGTLPLNPDPQLGLSFPRPLEFKGTITNTGAGFLVRAVLTISYQGSCSRCLETVVSEQQLELQEEFSSDQEDDGLLVIKGDELDLTEFLIEQAFLALPMRLLCSTECRGLCQNCGINLNKETCDCNQEYFNPEFAKLKSLLSPRGGGSDGKSNQ